MKKGWQTVALAEVCDFIDRRGITPEKLGGRFTLGGFRVISAKNIKGRQVDTGAGEQRFVDDSTYRKWMNSPLLVDDVLLTSEAPLGEPAYVDEELRWCLGQRLFGLRTTKSRLSGKFLFYALQGPPVRHDLLARATGATAQGIRQAELRKVAMPLPPLGEQERIVGVLDEAFAGLATAQANAEKNLQNARALFESHVESVFTQRGKGWVERPLEEVVDAKCTLSYGIVQPGDEYADGLPIVRPTDLGAKLITLEGLKRIDPRLAEGYRRTTLRGGELLLCVRGSTGVVSMTAPELAGANVTRGIVPIVFNPAIIRQDFGYFLIVSGAVQSQIRDKTYGTALMQINIGDLRRIAVAFPPVTEQLELAAKLAQLSIETQRLESIYRQKLAALAALKKSLLHHAFTGQL